MALNVNSDNENIRKIEDIIDIQKANGNINVRQVAFNVPCETDAICASLAKSLETGLSNVDEVNKKNKKMRSRRHKNPMPEVVSWPSDSDITVLRMKLYGDIKEKVGSILGDGLHQPDSSSMVNLATLIMDSQPQSKHSVTVDVEECLLPLTSWEQPDESESKELKKKEPHGFNTELKVYETLCSHRGENMSLRDSEACIDTSMTSKVARFLRLYFCPCCTCLYKLEKMKDEPSACFTQH